ncbi:MAG: MoxR family ATPase [Deltaproteobacteria bacterium]|nr:MoxR family ATPase [Deltaproteobacteria bacterium]
MVKTAVRGRAGGRKGKGTRKAKPACGVLRSLGFFGLDGIETSILAGLVTGDPVLLIGPHGAAKTALVRRLSVELGLRFWAYDASKALFEDVIGFPNPKSLSEGEVTYVPTPLSVWDKEFVLLDEISRASPTMQNKWLELVRARRMMGREVPGLRYVFAAMNPAGYLGANPLDEALAGRFAFVIPVPEAADMAAEDVAAIIATVTPEDAPACPELRALGCETAQPDRPASVADILRAAHARLPAVAGEYDAFVQRYVEAVAGQLAGKKLKPDGRRLGMIRRNLLAVIAVERLSGRLGLARLNAVFLRTLDHSLPQRALGQATPSELLYPCHALAWRVATEGRSGAGLFAPLTGRGDLVALIDAYERCLDTLPEEDHHEALNAILEELDQAEGAAKAAPLAALFRFTRAVMLHAGVIPSDVIGRAMDRLHKLGAYGNASWPQYPDALDRREGLQVDLASIAGSLALRCAVESTRDDEQPFTPVGAGSARALCRELAPALAGTLRGAVRRRRSR